MSLYTVRTKVIVRVAGISGPFEQIVTWHVNANSTSEAKEKYETRVRNDFKYMGYESIEFSYLEIIGTI